MAKPGRGLRASTMRYTRFYEQARSGRGPGNHAACARRRTWSCVTSGEKITAKLPDGERWHPRPGRGQCRGMRRGCCSATFEGSNSRRVPLVGSSAAVAETYVRARALAQSACESHGPCAHTNADPRFPLRHMDVPTRCQPVDAGRARDLRPAVVHATEVPIHVPLDMATVAQVCTPRPLGQTPRPDLAASAYDSGGLCTPGLLGLSPRARYACHIFADIAVVRVRAASHNPLPGRTCPHTANELLSAAAIPALSPPLSGHRTCFCSRTWPQQRRRAHSTSGRTQLQGRQDVKLRPARSIAYRDPCLRRVPACRSPQRWKIRAVPGRVPSWRQREHLDILQHRTF